MKGGSRRLEKMENELNLNWLIQEARRFETCYREADKKRYEAEKRVKELEGEIKALREGRGEDGNGRG